MGAKGFFISKSVGVVGIVLGAGAVATIIALSVVYSQEKAKADGQVSPTDGVITTAGTTTPTPSNEPWDKYRLPKSLVPDHYKVTLWPRLKPDPITKLYIFTGWSEVVFECVEETRLILIHSNKLNYTKPENGQNVSLTALAEGATAPAIQFSWLKAETQFLVLQLTGPLVKGQKYRLSTSFIGELADDLGGFYRSEYTENNVTKIVATTQMQPTDARKAFPCFDEPAMKAIFNITLIHDHGTIALSNGMEIETSNKTMDGKDVQVTVFEQTKKMSTYLLAFIVSDFKFISSIQNGVLVRIFARADAITAGQGEYALNWFGNLVTLKWWNDLWLNEGFASYVEYLGADHAEPTWNVKDLIVLSDVHRVMAVDALASSHPLSSSEEAIQRPEQISELFDAISYSKGASVLRMLSNFLTEEVFKEGLSSYLKTFAYGNTVYTNLWDHLQTAAVANSVPIPMKVHDIMNTWVLQMGFPLVTVDTSTGIVTQKHFLLDPESIVTEPSIYNYKWVVPIQWLKNGEQQATAWLKIESEPMPEMKVSGGNWVLANLDTVGYYRVNYDQGNWNRLLNVLITNHTALPVINRAQLIDDAFNLAR
ncbi:Aminopeptidase N [Merluccius polli]|uniref:Aminopeptidase N n=1 Tax=Merluccius polli TaxID=89951 RepID=A0AA47NCJ2_MERPO|nr:Aminopeptidase N [Merluccius polli]